MTVNAIILILIRSIFMTIRQRAYDSDYDADHGEDYIAITTSTMISLNVVHLRLSRLG